MPNYYATLGVPPDASDEEIVAAYLQIVEQADEVTVAQAERALGVLTDPAQRMAYDATRRGTTRQQAKQVRPAPNTRAAAPPRPATGTRAVPPRPPVSTRARSAAVPAPAHSLAGRGPLFAGVGAALLLGVVLLAVLLNKGAGSPSTGSSTEGAGAAPSAALLARAVTAPVGTNGVQTVDLIVDGIQQSYQPLVIRVKQGVPVRFNLQANSEPG